MSKGDFSITGFVRTLSELTFSIIQTQYKTGTLWHSRHLYFAYTCLSCSESKYHQALLKSNVPCVLLSDRPAYPQILLSVLLTAYVCIFRFLTGLFADAPPINQNSVKGKLFYHSYCKNRVRTHIFNYTDALHSDDYILFTSAKVILDFLQKQCTMWGRNSSLVVFGLAVHSVAGSILLWGNFLVEGIFPLELTWVQTPFPQKLFRMRV